MSHTIDFAHTPTARANRERKAHALATACLELGVTATGIDVGGGRRRDVWRAAGLKRNPSEDTWHVTATILNDLTPPNPTTTSTSTTTHTAPDLPPRARGECLYGCAGPARLYMRGWRCPEHAPAPPPTPPVGTTAAERRETFRAARAAEDARRAQGRR